MFKNVFLKLRFAARKARILLKTFYWSSARLLGKRGSRVLRPHSSALKSRGEKTHGRFPLLAPLFPLRLVPKKDKTRRTQSPQDAKNARNAITQRQRPQRKTQDATRAKSPTSAPQVSDLFPAVEVTMRDLVNGNTRCRSSSPSVMAIR